MGALISRACSPHGCEGNPSYLQRERADNSTWSIAVDHSSAQGELRADDALTLHVRDLVLAPAEPVPGNLQGTNPVASFHAVVSCQTVDDSAAPTVTNVRTADAPASPSGDADFRRPCRCRNPASRRSCSCRAEVASAAGSRRPGCDNQSRIASSGYASMNQPRSPLSAGCVRLCGRWLAGPLERVRR